MGSNSDSRSSVNIAASTNHDSMLIEVNRREGEEQDEHYGRTGSEEGGVSFFRERRQPLPYFLLIIPALPAAHKICRSLSGRAEGACPCL